MLTNNGWKNPCLLNSSFTIQHLSGVECIHGVLCLLRTKRITSALPFLASGQWIHCNPADFQINLNKHLTMLRWVKIKRQLMKPWLLLSKIPRANRKTFNWLAIGHHRFHNKHLPGGESQKDEPKSPGSEVHPGKETWKSRVGNQHWLGRGIDWDASCLLHTHTAFTLLLAFVLSLSAWNKALSLIHNRRCRRKGSCRSRWSPYH